jgi:DNA-binding transcriptional LysR family regulator
MDDAAPIPAFSLSQIDLRMLRALCAIARTGGFQSAADELGYTQSAISQQIAALERHVGLQLVGRGTGRRAVMLTDGGEVLRRHAEAILMSLDAAEEDLRALAGGKQGTLRVGCFRSVAISLLPAVLAELSASSPGVEVLIEEHHSDAALQRDVAYGVLDLSFAVLPVSQPSLQARELFSDPYVLLVRRDDPLAARATRVTVDDLAGRPLAASKCPHLKTVESALVAQGVGPGLTFRSDSNDLVIHFAQTGMATALVPGLVASELPSDVVALPAGHLFPPRQIGLVVHTERELPPYAERFVASAERLSRRRAAPATLQRSA